MIIMIKRHITLTIVATAVAFIFPLSAEDKKAPSEEKAHAAAAPAVMPPMSPIPRPMNAKVYIVSPKDGKTVKPKFTVRFGLKGMGVAPAGISLAEDKPTGHHHLVIDAEVPDLKLPFPMDDKRMHFGGGQTEVQLELTPGKHTLQLVLADHAHIPHDPPLVSEKITITVAE